MATTLLTLDGKKLFAMSTKARPTSRVSAGSDDISNDTALMLFSGGTTGPPKAVQLSHSNWNYFFRTRASTFYGPASDPLVHYLPLTHMYGFGKMFVALRARITILLLPRFNLEQYVRLVAKHKTKMLSLVPPVLVMMTQRPDIMRKYDLSSVEILRCAAAPVSANVIANVMQYFPSFVSANFSQAYGLTETTSGVVATQDQRAKDPLRSIGKVLPTVELKVVDELTRKSCGPNVHGELAVRSPTVMKGYYKDDKATANMIDQHGWLYTGDIGYYDDQGYIFIVDRAKELIKCRGNQVAPAELEDVLLSHPEIADAAVVGLPDELAGELPLAFVVRTHNGSVSDKQLQDFVAERVAPYKRLSGGVRFVESIPKLASGKVLRRQLRDSVRRPTHKL